MTSNETKTPNTRIKYLDGHADEVCVTMWQRCQAETHAKAAGWGNLMDAALKFNTYSAYIRCRQLGVTTLPFEQWADTVESVEDMKNDATDDAEPVATLNGVTLDAGGDMPGFSTSGTAGVSAN